MELDISQLVSQWIALAGFAALVALVVNIGKVTKVVKDGQASTWTLGLNLAGLVGFFFLRLFQPDLDVTQVSDIAGQLAQAGAIILSVVIQMGTSKTTHVAVKGVPVIGKSFSESVG